jgi:hypothetical protein
LPSVADAAGEDYAARESPERDFQIAPTGNITHV